MVALVIVPMLGLAVVSAVGVQGQWSVGALFEVVRQSNADKSAALRLDGSVHAMRRAISDLRQTGDPTADALFNLSSSAADAQLKHLLRSISDSVADIARSADQRLSAVIGTFRSLQETVNELGRTSSEASNASWLTPDRPSRSRCDRPSFLMKG